MELSFRWYGPNDVVKLTDIRQSNADYIVTSLHQIPAGEKWNYSDINERVNFIEKSNHKNSNILKINVIESIPVHNDIKLRKGNYRKYIDNYKDSIVNVAKNNIKTICYNFMPIIDWTRTQIDYKLPTDGLALRFSFIHFIIFEKFILKLPELEERYSENLLIKAENEYKIMSERDIDNLKFSIMGGLPASETKYNIDEFKNMLKLYKGVSKSDLQNNFTEFIREIIPIAEENNIKMALHPDDPPIPLLGLPRIVSTKEDYQYIFDKYDSLHNGMTFCSGSLASNFDNNVYEIFDEFHDRINFLHLRNVIIEKDKKSFYESDHLDGDVNFVKIIKMILQEEENRKQKIENYHIPMRPDHGHCLLDDKKKEINPGYSAIGRMKGLSEIRGILKTLEVN